MQSGLGNTHDSPLGTASEPCHQHAFSATAVSYRFFPPERLRCALAAPTQPSCRCRCVLLLLVPLLLLPLCYSLLMLRERRDGVLKLAILNGKFSFPRGRRGPLGQEYSNDFCELIGWMLTADPASRPRCPDIMKRVQGLMTRR